MLIDPKGLLFEERLAPITTSMGFFEGECNNAVMHFVNWHEELKKWGGYITGIRTSSVTGDLENILLSLLPLRMIDANRYLFIPARNGWTAYFDNGYRGTDPTVIGHLPELMHNRSIWVFARRHIEGLPALSPGALVLEVSGSEQREWLNLIRSIRLESNNGKWEFRQSGEPFLFEQTARYKAKRIRDRFDFSLLKQYLSEFGLSPFDENFYLPPPNTKATLVELKLRAKKVSGQKLDVSLEEARRLKGLE